MLIVFRSLKLTLRGFAPPSDSSSLIRIQYTEEDARIEWGKHSSLHSNKACGIGKNNTITSMALLTIRTDFSISSFSSYHSRKVGDKIAFVVKHSVANKYECIYICYQRKLSMRICLEFMSQENSLKDMRIYTLAYPIPRKK